jgi:hypothetical protein
MTTGWTEADLPRLNPQRVERIRALLTEALAPQSLEVADDSHKHAGHAGARGGQGHFGVDRQQRVLRQAAAGPASAGLCRAGRDDPDRHPCALDPGPHAGRGGLTRYTP